MSLQNFTKSAALALVLIFSTKNADAGLFDTFSKAGNFCKVVIGKGMENAVNAVANSSFKKSLDETPKLVGELLSQLGTITCTAGNCGLVASKTLVWEGAKAIYRTYIFNSSLDHVRKYMIVPLVGDLRIIREARNSNPEDLARAMARLAIFKVETEFKLAKMFSQKIILAPIGALVLPVNSGAPGPEAIARIFFQNVYGHIWFTLTEKNVDLNQRLLNLAKTEESVNAFLNEITKTSGFDLLENELKSWNTDHTNGKNEEKEPDFE